MVTVLPQPAEHESAYVVVCDGVTFVFPAFAPPVEKLDPDADADWLQLQCRLLDAPATIVSALAVNKQFSVEFGIHMPLEFME